MADTETIISGSNELITKADLAQSSNKIKRVSKLGKKILWE